MDEAYGRLDYDRRDGAAIITLRRPEALDALTLDMIDTIRVLESSTGADGKPRPHAPPKTERRRASMLPQTVVPRAMATMKAQVNRHMSMDFLSASEDTDRIMQEALRHPDAVEGARSYAERRPPRFAPFSEGFPK